MKKLLLFFVLAGLVNICNAQMRPEVAIALTNDGILVGKHVSSQSPAGNTYNTVMDTVDLKKVQSIYAVNGIYIDKQYEIHSLTPQEFQLFVKRTSLDTVTFKSASPLLTKEMKDKLQTLKSGDEVYIQYIKAADEKGNLMAVSPLFFLVK